MDIRTFSLLPDRETIDDKGHKKWFYYWKCKKFYASMIKDMEEKRPGMKIILHHRRDGEHARFNDEHYELWDPEHIIPMYCDEHTKLHETGIKHSKEWNENISKAVKGKKKSYVPPLTEERKLKISKALKGRKFAKWSEKRKKHHSECLKGHSFPESSRSKLSESLKKAWLRRKGVL